MMSKVLAIVTDKAEVVANWVDNDFKYGPMTVEVVEGWRTRFPCPAVSMTNGRGSFVFPSSRRFG